MKLNDLLNVNKLVSGSTFTRIHIFVYFFQIVIFPPQATRGGVQWNETSHVIGLARAITAEAKRLSSGKRSPFCTRRKTPRRVGEGGRAGEWAPTAGDLAGETVLQCSCSESKCIWNAEDSTYILLIIYQLKPLKMLTKAFPFTMGVYGWFETTHYLYMLLGYFWVSQLISNSKGSLGWQWTGF